MSKTGMNAEQVRAWMAGWQAVNRRVLDEARAKTMDQKLIELEQLFQFAKQLGKLDSLGNDTQAARDRWVRLRRAYGH